MCPLNIPIAIFAIAIFRVHARFRSRNNATKFLNVLNSQDPLYTNIP